MSASPPSEHPNNTPVATTASAMHENVFNICHKTIQYSEEEQDDPDNSPS